MGAFKLVRYVPSPQGGEYIPIETFVGSADELARELRSLTDGKPTFVDLLAPNEDVLVLGVGGPVATVAFGTLEMQREGRQIGVAGTVGDEVSASVDFDACGTPSPITRDLLVRADEMLTIARYFFETGELHPEFTWE